MAKAPRKTAEFVDMAGNEIDTVNPNVVTLDKPIKRAGQTIDKVTLIELAPFLIRSGPPKVDTV